MEKDKINTESENVETARDKGVTSTDLLDLDISIDNEHKKLKRFTKEIDKYKQIIDRNIKILNSSSSNLKFVECYFSIPFVILAILQTVCIGLLLFQIFY